MNTTAEMFFKYEYTETKELIKVFITLISATLVFSLTFAEKIVAFNTANTKARRTLIFSWICYIAALIGSGAAMCFIAAAAGKIIYGAIPFLDWPFGTLAIISWGAIITSGVVFVIGLGAMMAAAIQSSKVLQMYRPISGPALPQASTAAGPGGNTSGDNQI